jgi:hypothetical protein
VRRKPDGAPCGRDANPSGISRPLRRLGAFPGQGEDRMWRSPNRNCHAESMTRRNEGEKHGIQSASSQSEGSAGSERMTRRGVHGGPSPRGSGILGRVTSCVPRRTGGGSEPRRSVGTFRIFRS